MHSQGSRNQLIGEFLRGSGFEEDSSFCFLRGRWNQISNYNRKCGRVYLFPSQGITTYIVIIAIRNLDNILRYMYYQETDGCLVISIGCLSTVHY